MLANQIYDAPPAITLLDVLERKRRHLRAPESAAEQHSQDRPVTQTLVGGGVRGVQERLSMLGSQPIPETHASLITDGHDHL